MLWLVVLCSILASADGHGRLINPAGRSTMWRYGFSTPRNSNDHQLSCGGFGVQFYRNNGKCGVCGDPYGGPRENEAGGKYATGTIAKTYTQGHVIQVQVEITVNHGGWFEFRLCPNNDYRKKATQECLDRYLLRQTNGNTRYEMPGGLGIMTIQLQLPKELTCSQCLLQWKWNTASNMRCDGSHCCRGCGPQEQFYGCSDIAITRSTNPSGSQVLTPHTNNQTPLVHSPLAGSNVPGSFVPISLGGGHTGSLKPGGSTAAPNNQCKATFSYKWFNPSADAWCVQSCANNGYCPTTRCTEACRAGGQTIGPVCTATPFWRLKMPNADEWCKQRCQLGLCPIDYCNKTCLR